ncbi:MAG TPA: helix-turn-helix domain-containing protein [Cellulomonas sp.]|nr:helix-turn-helix domain-containing protein [Cellulomonas sp.]
MPDQLSPTAADIGEPDEFDDVVEGPRRGRGRPRDPDLEARALSAALEVFGEKGWVAMTIDEVATRARVGKSSIYLRWPDKTSLLTDALRQVQLGVTVEAAGGAADGDIGEPPAEPSLRDYLIVHATRRANLYLSDAGIAMLRLYVEARAHPDVFADIRRRAITDFVLDERRRVEAAIQLVDQVSPMSTVQLLDAVEGAVFIHVLVTPPELVDRVRRNLADYIEQMVDNQLRAVGLSPLGS